MWPWTLELLACPRTGSGLRLVDPVAGPDGRIVSGALVAEDGTRYPIVRGIPRLLVDYRSAGERQTVEAFGKEWSIFAEHEGFMRSAELFREFLPALPAAACAGRTVLDAGCGAGRWTQQLVRLGAARVIALDYSDAVEVCARKLGAEGGVVVVQGSLLAPPLRAGAIDVVVSIGVIHHLADPLGGLTALRRVLAPGGQLAFWVYGREGNELYLAVAERLRRVTRRLPPRPLLAVSWLLAAALAGYARTINRWVPLRADGSPRLPMQVYVGMLARLGLRDLTNVVYDQLTPALARYYRRDEVEALVAGAGLHLRDLHHRSYNSWSVLAEPTPGPASR